MSFRGVVSSAVMVSLPLAATDDFSDTESTSVPVLYPTTAQCPCRQLRHPWVIGVI